MKASEIATTLRYVGANVRRLRIERGLTQTALAKATGLKVRYVQILETGTGNPTVKVLLAIADALGAAPADFFEAAKQPTRRTGRPHSAPAAPSDEAAPPRATSPSNRR
jgi:transcriptional regulator with XRE-family HTH domain